MEVKDAVDDRYPPTFTGRLQYRYDRAVAENLTSLACEAFADRIEDSLKQVMALSANDIKEKPDLKMILMMTSSARMWRIVADMVLQEEYAQAEADYEQLTPEELEREREAMLYATGSVL